MKLRAALAKARVLALRQKADPDRVTILRRAEQEFERKCGKVDSSNSFDESDCCRSSENSRSPAPRFG